MLMAKKISEQITYSRNRMLSTAKYSEAFRFIRDKIMMGTSDKQILEEFGVLHEAIPEVYSINGGRPLSSAVLKQFRAGVEAEVSRQEKRKEWSKQATTSASDWFKTSPAVALVKQRLDEGCSYKEILEELDNLYKKAPELYSTRTGQPITTATLSLWAKRLGFENQTKIKSQSWKDNSVGYQWFKREIIAGASQEEIIAEFNARHESDPESYSTPMGAGMTISTFMRWRREVLESDQQDTE